MNSRDLATLRDELLAELVKIPLVDTHCHLEEANNLTRLEKGGFGILLHYVGCDLVSAAISPEHQHIANQEHLAPEARWAALEPYWEYLQHGSYMNVLNRGLRALHGVEGLTRENCASVQERMFAFYHNGGYEIALKQKANIDVSFIDPLEPTDDWYSRSHRGLNCDPHYFLCDYHERVTDLGGSFHKLAQSTGTRIHDLESWMEALYLDLKNAAPFAPGIKCTLGYSRLLDFAAVSTDEARPIARKVIDGKDVTHEERKTLVDYVIDRLCTFAAEFHLPVRFHTGMHAGGGNFIERANPLPLTDLIRRHPKTQFDLFHISYPYFREAALLAKYYGNVVVDLCWAWAFSPADTGQALHTFLDLVPINKIFGYGADYFHLEGVVGHAEVAREGIAWVLANRVLENRSTESEALDIARRVMNESPRAYFNVDEKRHNITKARRDAGIA